jgi:hypothetical protein
MTVRELIEKLEHVSEHHLETEVKFVTLTPLNFQTYQFADMEDVGDCIEIGLVYSK